MPDISIRWRLVLGYGVILTAVLAGLALFVYRLQESWLIDEAESRVRSQVAFALRAAENDLPDDREGALEDISAVRRAVLVLKGDTAYRPDQLYRAVGVQPFVDSLDPSAPKR